MSNRNAEEQFRAQNVARREQARLEIEEREKVRLKRMKQDNLNKMLVNAILANDLKRVQKLLEEGADPNFYDGSNGAPPKYGLTQSLMVNLAIRPGIQIGILDALLDAGADVQMSVRDPYAERSEPAILIRAAQDRRYDLLKLILSKRPDYDFDRYDRSEGKSFREIMLQGQFPFEITLWGIVNGIIDPESVNVYVEPEETKQLRIPAYVKTIKNLYRNVDIRTKTDLLVRFLERIFEDKTIATRILTEALTDENIQGKHAINRRKHLLAALSRNGGRRKRRHTRRKVN